MPCISHKVAAEFTYVPKKLSTTTAMGALLATAPVLTSRTTATVKPRIGDANQSRCYTISMQLVTVLHFSSAIRLNHKSDS